LEVSGQLHGPAVLRRSKYLWYQLDRRLGGSQIRSGCRWRGKKSHHCPCRELNPCRPACSLFSILTELHWLRVRLERIIPIMKELLHMNTL
jgi:hypothetical protein